MGQIGYAYLIGHLGLMSAAPLAHEHITAGVPQKKVRGTQTLHPASAMPADIVGHLEFALKHEGMNLQVLAGAFEAIPDCKGQLAERLSATPNGEYIRRLCFLYEWMHGDGALGDISAPKARYVELFPSERYETRANTVNNQRFRVIDNALGNPDFCPVVERVERLNLGVVREAIAEVRKKTDKSVFDRAIQYLYLSETKSSFSIENEVPDATRSGRFVQLLKRSGDRSPITEDSLIDAQNLIIAHDYSKEASFRNSQNWLEDASGQVTVLPPSPAALRRLMDGWLHFVSRENEVDPMVKAAAASFGFVYLHPFMDGNGRLHRFLIHKILSEDIGGMVLPVSAAMLKNTDEYLSVLDAFSRPVRDMWGYERFDTESPPRITRDPGNAPYAYFDASRECAFLERMIRLALYDELPNEIGYIEHFELAMERLKEFDLPQKDASLLVRLVAQNEGHLSSKKRKLFAHIDDTLMAKIEADIAAAFELPSKDSAPAP